MGRIKWQAGTEWKKYFFELVVIVVGITISFMVQNWQEARKSRHEEVLMLERIHSDLAEDTLAMRAEIKVLEDIVRYGESLLRSTQIEDMADSLNIFLGYQLQYSVFTKTDIGYQSMGQGRSAQLISNRPLLNKIIRLYALRYKELEEYGDVDKTFMLGEFIPYFNLRFPFVPDFDFQAFGAARFNTYLQADAFKNLLRANVLLKRQGVVRYGAAIDVIAGLMADIEQEIEALR